MKETKPPQEYWPRGAHAGDQKERLRRYGGSVIGRAERAGDETTIVKVADLRWLWDIANRARPKKRQPKSLPEELRQHEILGKALATARVRIARGMSRDEAYRIMYETIRSELHLARKTAKRRLDLAEVREIARFHLYPRRTDIIHPTEAEFWAQFPDVTAAERAQICEKVSRRTGEKSRRKGRGT
jgi:hypothetical protein